MTRHLTPDEIAGYIAGTLSSGELLRVDDHLAACDACRRGQAGNAQLTPAVTSIRAALRAQLAEGPHPSTEEIAAYVDATLDDTDRDIIQAHLDACSDCLEDMNDLRALTAPAAPVEEKLPGLPPSSRMLTFRGRRRWYAAGGLAAAATFAGVLVWKGLPPRESDSDRPGTRERVQREPQPAPSPRISAPSIVVALKDRDATVTLDSAGTLRGVDSLESADQAILVSALRDRIVPLASGIAALRPRGDTLMRGPSARASFGPVRPVATYVDDPRPTFEWRALSGATTYQVSVFDERFEKVVESPTLAVTRWRPAQTLPRGKLYFWQVKARTPQGEVLTPAPPDPEARFRVLAPGEAHRVETIKRRYGRSHLALGVLLAGVGLLDEAELELEALAAANADAVVADLLASVRAARGIESEIRNRRPRR